MNSYLEGCLFDRDRMKEPVTAIMTVTAGFP